MPPTRFSKRLAEKKAKKDAVAKITVSQKRPKLSPKTTNGRIMFPIRVIPKPATQAARTPANKYPSIQTGAVISIGRRVVVLKKATDVQVAKVSKKTTTKKTA